MKYKVDPQKFPEWYSAQYSEQDKKLIKEVCEKQRQDDILRRKGR